jgi:hypothetical protein
MRQMILVKINVSLLPNRETSVSPAIGPREPKPIAFRSNLKRITRVRRAIVIKIVVRRTDRSVHMWTSERNRRALPLSISEVDGTGQKCCNVRTPTEAIYPSSLEENRL